MKIIWTENALVSYEKIIEDILLKWNFKIVLDFELLVNILISKLEKNKNLCPKSKKTKFRKCLISKQSSLIYQIYEEKTIELLAFVDR